jgi:predicted hotdog family 3-hydroxylacyl-ACP dehydratase
MMALTWTAEELLPHSGVMVLVDEALDAGEGWITAAVRIAEDSLFYEPPLGVPSWVGAEYMAQTVGLYAGYCSKQAGREVRIGLWLGTRRYETEVAHFQLGSDLRIRAEEVWQDDQMAVFDCSIEDGRRLATARLNVFSPRDQEAFIKEHMR